MLRCFLSDGFILGSVYITFYHTKWNPFLSKWPQWNNAYNEFHSWKFRVKVIRDWQHTKLNMFYFVRNSHVSSQGTLKITRGFFFALTSYVYWWQHKRTWIIWAAKNTCFENCRSSRPKVFCKKGVLRNFTKFTGKHLCQSLFFNKVAGLSPTTKKRGSAFPVNFVEFVRTHFFTERLWWLLYQ